MIYEIPDDEILGFLMTSDFEGDYSPEELKYLLVKWRFFYRVLNGAYERTKVENDGLIGNLKFEIESMKSQSNTLMVENADKENLIMSIKNKQNRKLTWKERLTGKIESTDEN